MIQYVRVSGEYIHTSGLLAPCISDAKQALCPQSFFGGIGRPTGKEGRTNSELRSVAPPKASLGGCPKRKKNRESVTSRIARPVGHAQEKNLIANSLFHYKVHSDRATLTIYRPRGELELSSILYGNSAEVTITRCRASLGIFS